MKTYKNCTICNLQYSHSLPSPSTSPLTDVQEITLGSAMYIKGLFSKSMQYNKVD